MLRQIIPIFNDFSSFRFLLVIKTEIANLTDEIVA